MSSFTINIAYAAKNEAVAKDIAYKLSPINVGFNLINSEQIPEKSGFFKELLAKQNPCLLLISDNFLKSIPCMENGLHYLQTLIKNDQIIPIIIDGIAEDDEGNQIKVPTEFERVSNVIKYMNYWQESYLELRKLKRSISAEEEGEFNIKLKKIRNISSEVGEFLRYLRDIDYYSEEGFRAKHFEVFFNTFGDEQSYAQYVAKATAIATLPKVTETPAPEPTTPEPIIEQPNLVEEEVVNPVQEADAETFAPITPINVLKETETPLASTDIPTFEAPPEIVFEDLEQPIKAPIDSNIEPVYKNGAVLHEEEEQEEEYEEDELEGYVTDEADESLEELAAKENRNLSDTELLALELANRLPKTTTETPIETEDEKQEEEEMFSLDDLLGEDSADLSLAHQVQEPLTTIPIENVAEENYELALVKTIEEAAEPYNGQGEKINVGEEDPELLLMNLLEDHKEEEEKLTNEDIFGDVAKKPQSLRVNIVEEEAIQAASITQNEEEVANKEEESANDFEVEKVEPTEIKHKETFADDFKEEEDLDEELEGYFVEEGEENREEEEEDIELSEIDILQASNILAQSGKISESIHLLKSALSEAPEFLSVRYQYAAFLAQYQNNFKEASNQLAILLEEEPTNLSAKFFLGELAEAERDYISAKDYYEKVYTENPEYPNVQYKLGMLLVHHLKEAPEEAATYLSKSYELNPNNINALYQYGVLQSEALDEEEAAILSFEKVIAKAPEHPFANYDLALLYYNLGDSETAQNYYKTACAINPELKTEENDQAFYGEEEVSIEEKYSLDTLNAEIDEKVGLHNKLGVNGTGDTNLLVENTPYTLSEIVEEVESGEIVQPVSNKQVVQQDPPKIVLITGATSGIGRATAEVFAQNGYKLILTGRRYSRLLQLKESYEEQFGSTIQLLPFDIRSQTEVQNALGELNDEWKEIDILINNAGLAKGFEPIHEGNLEDWETMIDTNLKGLLYMTRAIAPFMVKRRTGHIINICSIAGKEVYPNGGVYCATKHGVDALTKAMRIDLHKYNIRVSQVTPGHVEETEFALVRFNGNAENAKKVYDGFRPINSTDVAEVIHFMASRPPHVNVQDVVMMGTQQASATITDRSGREL